MTAQGPARRCNWFLWSLLAALQGFACGPDFPNSLLSQGDEGLLAAPTASFIREISRLTPSSTSFVHVPRPVSATRAGIHAWTVELEKAALATRIEESDVPVERRGLVVKSYGDIRARLTQFIVDWDAWTNAITERADAPDADAPAKPRFPSLALPNGMPQEYALYLQGSIAWHNPAVHDKSTARKSWERLLELPPKQRQDKSVWAAFMIGRSWEGADLAKCRAAFRQCRSLVQAGFQDPTGLAAASLGLEARECLRRQQFEDANDLYLQQFASGDRAGAADSLCVVATRALAQEPPALAAMARNQRLQHVINSFLLARLSRYSTETCDVLEPGEDEPKDLHDKWLQALDTADVRNVQIAGQLALLAYQNNDMQRAERWIRRAGSAPVVQWIRAKLLLRQGKMKEASEVLGQVIRYVRVRSAQSGAKETSLFESLFMQNGAFREEAASQVLGEAGVIYVALGEYMQALDLMLQGGMWSDAAYLAERVLSVQELKSFVDEFYPTLPATPTKSSADEDDTAITAESDDQPLEEDFTQDADVTHAAMTENIRYLLARRLSRLLRFDEARQYYPAQWTAAFDVLTDALRRGWDEALPADERAIALFEAGVITRTNGLELTGTEVEPDWNLYAGNFQGHLTAECRAENEDIEIAKPLPEERLRYNQHGVDPPQRWHYRYQAAALAWEAARLMPDNSDDTAYVLWRAGTWLKVQDPPTADIFYKSLVRRNRQTALGQAADRLRWFPRADDSGQPILEEQPASPDPASSDPLAPQEEFHAPTEDPLAPVPAE